METSDLPNANGVSKLSSVHYPLQTNLPHEHGTVSTGCLFSNGRRQTGQFLRHIRNLSFSHTGPANEATLVGRGLPVCTNKHKTSLFLLE